MLLNLSWNEIIYEVVALITHSNLRTAQIYTVQSNELAVVYPKETTSSFFILEKRKQNAKKKKPIK